VTKPRIFVVSQGYYLRPFADMFDEAVNIASADVVMFTGGEDVHPDLYGEKEHPFTNSNIHRDRHEAKLYAYAEDHGMKKLGICRGSQFLTVQNHGRLVQHVSNHGRTHEMHTAPLCCPRWNNQTLLVSSTHHQMMNPFALREGIDYRLLAWADSLSDRYENGEKTDIPMFVKSGLEPEVVWYPRSKSLAIQPHPEIMQPNSKGVEFFRAIVEQYIVRG
jgi:gamma-glutamyl-gamma-aminobutyrate hydrolase PuuD